MKPIMGYTIKWLPVVVIIFTVGQSHPNPIGLLGRSDGVIQDSRSLNYELPEKINLLSRAARLVRAIPPAQSQRQVHIFIIPSVAPEVDLGPPPTTTSLDTVPTTEPTAQPSNTDPSTTSLTTGPNTPDTTIEAQAQNPTNETPTQAPTTDPTTQDPTTESPTQDPTTEIPTQPSTTDPSTTLSPVPSLISVIPPAAPCMPACNCLSQCGSFCPFLLFSPVMPLYPSFPFPTQCNSCGMNTQSASSQSAGAFTPQVVSQQISEGLMPVQSSSVQLVPISPSDLNSLIPGLS